MTHPSLIARLRARLDERAAANSERILRVREADDRALDLASNDYLSLSRHPALAEAASAALATWGASSSASPLIRGYTAEHAALESDLRDWTGFAHGLVWNTGYAANHAVLGSLPQPGDLILADRLVHNSMVAGILRSGARLVRFPHNDIGALDALLRKHAANTQGTLFVATESVYSMDGDHPDLRHIAALRREHGFFWILDEAHATGWYGPQGQGLAAAEGVAADVDLLVGTLGKGLGSMGAYTLFHEETLRRHFINFADDFIYSTYLAPSCAAAARAAIRLVRATPAADRDALHALSRRWRDALRAIAPEVPDDDSPVIPVILGDEATTLACARRLRGQGVIVGAVRPPTVPKGRSRLRLSLHAGLSDADLSAFTAALRTALHR